jgi:hypothetical protein
LRQLLLLETARPVPDANTLRLAVQYKDLRGGMDDTMLPIMHHIATVGEPHLLILTMRPLAFNAAAAATITRRLFAELQQKRWDGEWIAVAGGLIKNAMDDGDRQIVVLYLSECIRYGDAETRVKAACQSPRRRVPAAAGAPHRPRPPIPGGAGRVRRVHNVVVGGTESSLRVRLSHRRAHVLQAAARRFAGDDASGGPGHPGGGRVQSAIDVEEDADGSAGQEGGRGVDRRVLPEQSEALAGRQRGGGICRVNRFF